MKTSAYIYELLQKIFKRYGYLPTRIYKTDEMSTNTNFWMNLDHLKIYSVKLYFNK